MHEEEAGQHTVTGVDQTKVRDRSSLSVSGRTRLTTGRVFILGEATTLLRRNGGHRAPRTNPIGQTA